MPLLRLRLFGLHSNLAFPLSSFGAEPAGPFPAGKVAAMPGYDDLSTEELHDRAIRRAERHLDVKFLWELIEQIPSARLVTVPGRDHMSAVPAGEFKRAALEFMTAE